MVTLQPITRDNWRECSRLQVAEHQRNFVASNLYSIAQSKAQPECVPLAIYAGEAMVGFAMYALDVDDGRYWIYRLMIDAAQQGKGYGRAAMRLLLDLLRAIPDCSDVTISYEPENDVARKLYASLGFRETGEMISGEVVARLRFEP